MRRIATSTLVSLAALAALADVSFAQAPAYRLERVASGLRQPVSMSQAPGDPENIIYYMTRVTTGGANAANGTHGSLWRYDMNTRASTEVLNLSHRNLTLDLGPQGFTFHPDFNNVGTAGYKKIYVSSAATAPVGGQPPINYVEEYAATQPDGSVPKTGGSGPPIVNRLLLQYANVFADNNHVIDWIGFDPRAHSAPAGSPERNYLFVSAGDGSNNQNATNRPEQKPNILQGKLLRIDIDPTHADAYPADPLKNFAIPATNPIPLWNATHGPTKQLVGTTLNYVNPTTSTSYSPALPEIYFTGTRNTYRMSLDKATGNFWSGDVGENGREEINFLPADPYDGSQLPYDFGYPQREGTANPISRSAGNTFIRWNLSGGEQVIADSINPIQEGPHATLNNGSTSGTLEIRSTTRSAYIGGYVYRGPIAELQGKYFYSDFVQGNIMMLDFDESTPVASFSGLNFNQNETQGANSLASLGTESVVLNRNLNSLWQSLVTDPSNPNYTAANNTTAFGVGRVVSFGEDNAGNLYIIDMGGTRGDAGFGNDYPGGTTGEIFRLTPVLALTLQINRQSGAMTIVNETGVPINFRSYSIASTVGALAPAEFTPITGNFDAPPGGNGSIDGNDDWQITSPAASTLNFAEASLGDAGTLAPGGTFALSVGDGWTPSMLEDITFNFTRADGSNVLGAVVYSGDEIVRSDLDGSGVIDLDDWRQFLPGFLTNLAGMTPLAQYLAGDINRDGVSNFDDFRAFQADYNAANGTGAFEAATGVPEPAGASLALVGLAAAAVRRGRESKHGEGARR